MPSGGELINKLEYFPMCTCTQPPVVSDSLRSHGLQPTRLLCPWDSPGNIAGVDCQLNQSEIKASKSGFSQANPPLGGALILPPLVFSAPPSPLPKTSVPPFPAVLPLEKHIVYL